MRLFRRFVLGVLDGFDVWILRHRCYGYCQWVANLSWWDAFAGAPEEGVS